MNHKYLLLFSLICCVQLPAQNSTLVFNHSGGIKYRAQVCDIDSFRITPDEKYASFSFNMGQTAVYDLSTFDSLTFVSSASEVATFPKKDDFVSSLSESFNPSYRNVSEVIETNTESNNYNDFVENYSSASIITITFSESTATVTGNYDKTLISITNSGANVTVRSAKKQVRYVLKGKSGNGSFKIYSDNKYILELSGVDITNPVGAAINNQSSKSCCVILKDGTTNRLKDGEIYAITPNEDQKGAFFSEGQLIFSGTGSLNVTSLSAHGICSDDYIRLRSNCGPITINAGKDGISTKDNFIMYGCNLNITSEDDGISISKGFASIQGGNITVRSIDNGIVADYDATDTTHIYIAGGMIDIETTGSKGHAITSSGRIDITGGAIKAIVNGEASKCITGDLGMSISNISTLLITKGDPIYEDLEADYSSAAAIRSKAALSISNSNIKVMSTGKGGKCINVIGDINIDNSKLTLVTEGPSFISGEESVRPRAIDSNNLSIVNGSTVNIGSSHSAVYTESNLSLTGSDIFAFTTDGSAKCLNIKGSLSQTGGLLMYGISE
jgi:hypothetical protein